MTHPRARALYLVIVGVLISAAFPAVAAPRGHTFALRSGEALFWSGPSESARCPKSTSDCWEYALHVEEGAWRLRIGIDHATVGDVFEVQVFRPSGGSAGSFSPGNGLYSAELIDENPQPGRWRIEVRPADDVSDPRFQMRAKLESAPLPQSRRLAPPNLQVQPPYNFTFQFPVTDGGFRNLDGRAYGVPGPASCHPEEYAQENAVRCLRMTFGVRNVGLGPMALFYRDFESTAEQTLYQRVYRLDGSSFDREAGVARFHASHGHYHHDEAIALRLFRVDDPKAGSLEPIGAEHRKGFAHRDELLREWDYFYPIWDWDGFGLSPGWADYYEWDRPGNYIDFGVSLDGRYVLRMTADPGRGVLESNEKDNVGYSYIEVSGTTIEVLESGLGRDPWDPCKIVLPIGAEPDPPRQVTDRPPHCPPDPSIPR
ncbi:MAG TPA: hypothetical protein VHJ82_09335 [Actinomycetota bacterium]|nr:hypothetical protein [Actinomycetota bacterium]